MADFKSINVENLNILDKDGKVRLRLFNTDHIPPLIMDGKDILPGHRQNDPMAGLMFYNGDGEECGGLTFGSKQDENGNYESAATITFDQYKQDQLVQMHYIDDNGEKHYGFSIYDRPNTPLSDL
jgi:hypothetical protein